MDLKEAIQKINRLERRVLWRKRWLAFQDALALSLLVTGLLSAGFVVYARLRPLDLRWSTGVAAILTFLVAVVLIRWLVTRPTPREAAFAIDERMNLEDRITTARAILERGGPDKPVEIALIEDAAAQIDSARASSVMPYGLRRWHALSIAAMVAVGATLMIPQKAVPRAQELAVERAEIQSAGEQLEKSSDEVERLAPSGSQTAKLAREQADLGRALRRSLDSRAEVLRKLSALQERIQTRRDELAETRADEVVTLAEQRLRSAVAEKPRQSQEKAESGVEATEIEAADQQARASLEKRATAPGAESRPGEPTKTRAAERASKNVDADQKAKTKSDSEEREVASKNPVREKDARPKDGAEKSAEKGTEKSAEAPTSPDKNATPQAADQGKRETQLPDASSKTGAQEAAPKSDQAGGDQGEKSAPEQSEQQKPEIPGEVAGAVAEQAAKVLPSLSEQLLKKAEQLRVNELKPEDIQRLQQAAQLLARDLEKIAQSKELQKTLEELVKQVKPEQLEQIARQLANNEQLKREMEAAAKLMMENQQTKRAVAGLAQELAEQRDQFKQQQGQPGGPAQRDVDLSGGLKLLRDGTGPGSSRGNQSGRYERGRAGEKLNSQGKQERVSGRLQRGAGGEYLYLQAKPGAGASRAAYSSGYPQYRREAERSVERSRVPARMRSVVRDYFDAINPDVNKKP